jgi:hypothetical protein
MTFTRNIALVDETNSIGNAVLAEVAGALSAYLSDDVAKHYPHVRAVVTPQPKVNAGQWSLRVQDQLDQPDALGYHTEDKHNQPVSYIEKTADWTVTAAHEAVEMSVDPSGNETHGARLPFGLEDSYARFGLRHSSTHVIYLLEPADPCEAVSYEIGGVPVSDFLLLPYYRTNPGAAVGYSFTGAIHRPREVLPGGYVSFANPDGEWFQVFNQGGQLQVQDIGRFDRASWSSLREWTDHHARTTRQAATL